MPTEFAVTTDRLIVFVLILLAAWSGVATRRVSKGKDVWTKSAVVYSLIAAILTWLLLSWLHLTPP